MSDVAHVESFDALKAFKVALRKFAEAANVALGDSESDTHRVTNWLEIEQASYWQSQVRKRTEAVSRAKEAVRMKKLFKDASGRPQSAVDEEKALKIAERSLAEAEQKFANVRRWTKALPREIEMYKGSVQRFATTVQVDIPAAIHRLDKMISSLEAYASLSAPTVAGSAVQSGSSQGEMATVEAASTMARAEPAEAPADEVPEIPAEAEPPANPK